MAKEIKITDTRKIEEHYSSIAQTYGISCKVITTNKYPYLDESERYLVFGLRGVPEDLNVKDIYIRNKRSNFLFYTDYWVIKLDEKSSVLGLLEEVVAYCKTVLFLKKLFREYKTPLPLKLRGSEIGGLKDWNSGRNNKLISPEARARSDKKLKAFFKQEQTKSKYLQEWRAFMRSDQYDQSAKPWKMFADFHHRNDQIISLDLLRASNGDFNTTKINEHEFVRFKEVMKRLYPEVSYSVSEKKIQNTGVRKQDIHKPAHKVKTGPFGKLVSYEVYCDEREKNFAKAGFEAIKELSPAYFETRELIYKEIDEPYIAAVLNSIRFSFAKSDNLAKVIPSDIDVFSFVDVPVGNMMNFVSLAKANNVPFYLDFFGEFGSANLETVRAVYSPLKDDMMKSIVSRMVGEKVVYDRIATSLDENEPSLETKINQASRFQAGPSGKNFLIKEDKNYEF